MRDKSVLIFGILAVWYIGMAILHSKSFREPVPFQRWIGRVVLFCLLILAAPLSSSGADIPGRGTIFWEPSGWVYVDSTSTLAWNPPSASWRYVDVNPVDGPFTWSYLTQEFFNFIFVGWNFFRPIRPGEYYYYNASIGAWYFVTGSPYLSFYDYRLRFFGLLY